ncbi:MAG: hypothetical protein PF692_06715 [Kiritimatiellae bacterium]|jgi:hypothetical protein|nr:hypothetical protein [Kiritimatiellia bacterium]
MQTNLLLRILFSLLLASSVHHRLEADTNNFHLVVTDRDEGAINIPSIESGVVSFSKTNTNTYEYKGVEQTFSLGGKGEGDLYCFRRAGIIVAKSDNPSVYKIINLKYPNHSYDFQLETYTPLAVSPNYKDKLIMCEYINPDEFKVSFYDTLTGVKTTTDPTKWEKSSSSESFFITDAIRFCRMGMGHQKYLPLPPEEFLKINDNRSFILSTSPDKLPADEVKTIARVSSGDNTIYFLANHSASTTLPIWIYDQIEEKWMFDDIPLNACEIISFGNNLAVRHASRISLAQNRTYSGVWSIYLSGKKLETYLGWDSNVLYLTDTTLIFNDSSRLYECDINAQSLIISKPRLIAEHNYIRYAKSLFFQHEEKD